MSDDFGTGEDENDIPNWEETGTESDSKTKAKEASGSDDDTVSPDGGRFALIGEDSDWICRQVVATGYGTLSLKYYYRGDKDAEDNEVGRVEYATGGTCDSPTGLTTITDHELDDGNDGSSPWSSLQTVSLPGALNNTSFYIRFRNPADSSNEDFRIDGVSVTGELTTGTIVIVKDAVPDDAQDFSFTSDIPDNTSFSLDDDADGTLSNTETVSSVEAGTYTVTEDALPAGWSFTNLDCEGGGEDTSVDTGTRTATIGLDAGETVTCTYTNTKLGTVTVVKNANPDDEQEFDFTSTLPDGSSFSLTDTEGGEDESITFSDVPLGDYTITEDANPTNWNLTSIDCEGGDDDGETSLGSRTASINVDAGESIICTFTNTKNGTLQINKEAYGGDGTFDFTIDPEGAGENSSAQIITGEGEGSVEVSLPPDDYFVTETAQAGWQVESNGCSSVVVTAGQTTACTVTNVKQSTIEFRKQTIDGFDTFDFTGTLDGEDDDFGGEDGFSLTTSEGENPASTTFSVYTDSEGSTVTFNEPQDGEDGWTLSGKSCTIDDEVTGEGESSSYTFDLNPGEAAICTFINDQAICNNNDVEEGEQCDNGGEDGDGCSNTCTIESGWACTGDPSSCSANCGDEIIAGSETCDDGETDAGDGCSETCQLEVCGDGSINNQNEEDELPDEQCDDSNDDSDDGCSSTCQIEEGFTCPVEGSACGGICGDGLVRGEEECDDGEGESAGCSSECTVDEGYACSGEPSVCSNGPGLRRRAGGHGRGRQLPDHAHQ